MAFDSVAWQVFGRVHFLVLHFPIALVVLVGLLEFTAPLWDRRGAAVAHEDDDDLPDGARPRVRRSRLTGFILLVAAVGAVVAAGSGWVYADNEVVSNDAVNLHRWFGVGAACAVVVALLARVVMPRGAYLAVLALAVVGTGVTGHLGGELVHGKGFVLAPLGDGARGAGDGARSTVQPSTVTGGGTGGSGSIPGREMDPEPVVVAVSFERDVFPIIDASCVRCHGAERQKGGVRLDTLADVREFIVAGEPERSLLIEVVEHDPSHPMHMPRNEESLSAEAIATLRAWIEGL